VNAIKKILGKATVAVVLLMLSAQITHAQALLKPSGRDAATLQMARFNADVQIKGGMAVTTLTMIYRNPYAERIEADFLYQLPTGAVATDFAYWYEDEKVIARVAEKEKAATIYQYITTRQRDPALVEMVGKNKFRARIFPVMPNADLKIEMRFVRALTMEKGGLLYDLPLAIPKDAPPMETCQIHVNIAPDTGQAGVQNNWSIATIAQSTGERTLDFSADKYRPTKDFRVRLTEPDAPLLTHLRAAPSGGTDGFFALTIAPKAGSANAKAHLTGGSVYDVRQRPLGAGILLTGRYKSACDATVSLGGQKATVHFDTIPEPNGPATKLWAAEKIASLGKSDRKTIIALSLRHTIPSKFTSWIAIPKAEAERYKYERAQAEASLLARQISRAAERGETENSQMKEARAQFEALCKANKLNAKEILASCLEEDAWGLADKAVRGDRRALRAVHRLATLGGLDPKMLLASAKRNYEMEYFSRATRRFEELLLKGKENTKEGKYLLEVVQKAEGRRNNAYMRHGFVQQKRYEIASQIVLARESGRLREANKALQELARLSKPMKLSAEKQVEKAREQILSARLYQAQTDLRQAIDKGKKGDIQKAEKRIAAAATGLKQSPQQIIYTIHTEPLRSKTWEYINRYIEKGKDNPETLQSRREMDTVATKSKMPLEPVLQEVIKQYAGGFNNSSDSVASLRSAMNDKTLNDILTLGKIDKEAYLKESVLSSYWYQNLLSTIPREQFFSANPDEERVEEARQKLVEIHKEVGIAEPPHIKPYNPAELDEEGKVRAALLTERRKTTPDTSRIATLEKQLTDLTIERRSESYGYSTDATVYAKARIETIGVEVEIDQLEKLPQTTAVKSKIVALSSRQKALHARMGDPLLSLDAPQNAKMVVAKFTDGTIKPLVWNWSTSRWEVRFDIPGDAKNGKWDISVTVLYADGKREEKTVSVTVDMTPPTATSKLTQLPDGRWRLDVFATADTSRVTAFTPEPTALLAGEKPGAFYLLLDAAPPQNLRIILTDKAHNRTEITH
jgi:hypothetical protein